MGRPKTNPEFCTHDGCERAATTRQMCDMHYRRWKRAESGEVRSYERNAGRTCEFDGCDLAAERKGLCSTHYAYWKRTGDKFWNSDRRRKGTGSYVQKGPNTYFYSSKNGKYQGEHRHIMEAHLGRDLLPGETVHHKNGDTLDNRIENLELMAGFHPRGQRPEDLLAFAREITERYG